MCVHTGDNITDFSSPIPPMLYPQYWMRMTQNEEIVIRERKALVTGPCWEQHTLMMQGNFPIESCQVEYQP